VTIRRVRLLSSTLGTQIRPTGCPLCSSWATAPSRAQKHQALHSLGTLTDRLPPDVISQLKPIADTLTDPHQQRMASPFEREDAVGAASFLAARLDPSDPAQIATRVSALLLGDSYKRQWAARTITHVDRPERSGMLVALVNDADPDVRAAAAAGLAFVASHEPRDEFTAEGLHRTLGDPGTRVAASIAHVLARSDQSNDLVIAALNELTEHPSAYVRSTAAAGLVRHRPCSCEGASNGS
jgi:HEAT repeat protein